jgi:AcrR family transcriptional regulator
MHAHLLERSLTVFAERGVEVSIDDIIVAAEVSRGTFYNYFQTSHDVLIALGDALAKEVIDVLYTTLQPYDAVHRVGLGVRLFLHLARKHKRFAAFLWRTSFHAATTRIFLQTHLSEDVAAGMSDGSFELPNAETGFLSVVGVTLTGIYALSNMTVPKTLPEDLAGSALRALGVKRKLAEKVCSCKLPAVAFPEGSLMART